MAIRGLSHIGNRYILGLVGIIAWPLGWAVAAIVTQGLLTFMTDQSFLQGSSVSGAANYGLQNFIGVALLGVWIIFSTIAAPVIIQKALVNGYQAGEALLEVSITLPNLEPGGGRLRFTGIEVVFVSGLSGSGSDVLLGQDFLSRFTLTIDGKARQFVLRLAA